MVVLFPILSIYGIGVSTINWANIFMLIVFGVIIISPNRLDLKKDISYPILFLSFYVLFELVHSIIIDENTTEIVLRTFRYLAYLLFLAFFTKKYFSFEYGKRVYCYVAIFAICFIVFQTILLKISGIYISGYIPGAPILNDGVVDFANNLERYANPKEFLVRPRSIFEEPAHFSQDVLAVLALVLFSDWKDGKKLKWGFFVTFGLLLSMSNTGFLVGIIVWLNYFFRNSKKYIYLFPVVIIVVVAVYYLPITQSIIDRLFDGRSAGGRFNGYSYVFDSELSLSEFLFGHGMINTQKLNVYLAGYARLFWYFGVTGILLFASVFIALYKSGNNQQRELLIIAILLNIGSDAILGPFFFPYYSLIISNNDGRHCYLKL